MGTLSLCKFMPLYTSDLCNFLYVYLTPMNKLRKKKASILDQVKSTSLFCPKGGGVQVPRNPGGLAPPWCHKSPPSTISETCRAPYLGILFHQALGVPAARASSPRVTPLPQFRPEKRGCRERGACGLYLPGWLTLGLYATGHPL